MDTDEIKDDIRRYTQLNTLGATEGGQILVKSFTEDVLSIVTRLSNGWRTLSHDDMKGMCASMEDKLDVVRTISLSAKNRDAAVDALSAAMTE